MQTSNEMFANSSSVLTSQVQPVKNGIGFRLLDPADSAQTVALNQHSHCIQKYVLLGSQSFKECSFVGAKSVVTGGAVKTTLSMAIDPDVVTVKIPHFRTILYLHRKTAILRCYQKTSTEGRLRSDRTATV